MTAKDLSPDERRIALEPELPPATMLYVDGENSVTYYALGPQQDGAIVLRIPDDYHLVTLRKAIEKQEKNAVAATGTLSTLAEGVDPFVLNVQRALDTLKKLLSRARAPENQVSDTPMFAPEPQGMGGPAQAAGAIVDAFMSDIVDTAASMNSDDDALDRLLDDDQDESGMADDFAAMTAVEGAADYEIVDDDAPAPPIERGSGHVAAGSALDFPCDHCHVPAGQPCQSVGGNLNAGPHMARLRAGERALGENDLRLRVGAYMDALLMHVFGRATPELRAHLIKTGSVNMKAKWVIAALATPNPTAHFTLPDAPAEPTGITHGSPALHDKLRAAVKTEIAAASNGKAKGTKGTKAAGTKAKESKGTTTRGRRS